MKQTQWKFPVKHIRARVDLSDLVQEQAVELQVVECADSAAEMAELSQKMLHRSSTDLAARLIRIVVPRNAAACGLGRVVLLLP